MRALVLVTINPLAKWLNAADLKKAITHLKSAIIAIERQASPTLTRGAKPAGGNPATGASSTHVKAKQGRRNISLKKVKASTNGRAVSSCAGL